MGPAAARPAPRKRVRKRKRRAVSLSSSSSSSSSSDSEADENPPPPKVQVAPQSITQEPEPSSSSSSESSSSSSSSEDESEPEQIPRKPDAESTKPRPIRQPSRSPSPPSAEIPSFLDAKTKETEEQMMKAKFRKFWMASVADGFKDDLEEIRKEQNLGASRLAVLIDSLGAGAAVFSSSEII